MVDTADLQLPRKIYVQYKSGYLLNGNIQLEVGLVFILFTSWMSIQAGRKASIQEHDLKLDEVRDYRLKSRTTNFYRKR